MKIKRSITALFFLLLFALHAFLVLAPPSPHNVAGRVFNSDGVSGVPNGIVVKLNNTNSTDIVFTQVNAPPIPSLFGSYSATINGSDNDTIIGTAWNATHYGSNTTNLSTTTTSLNIVLSQLRPSETNATILSPLSFSLINISEIFNITARIGVIGGSSGTNCNATISFSNENLINITPDQNFTNQLGNIALGSSVITRWNATTKNTGVINITLLARCASDTINFDELNINKSINITISDSRSPNISLIYPLNNSRLPSGTDNHTIVQFYYNVSDNSQIKNCTLIVNGRANMTNVSIQRNTPQFFEGRIVAGNYNWSVNCTDNSTSQNVGSSPFFNFTITSNSAPIVLSLRLPQLFDLFAGRNTTFHCNATIRDEDNSSDIRLVNATFFQDSIGGNSIDDHNDHYTNSSCGVNGTSTFESNYTCSFAIRYFANNGTWQCNLSVSDFSNSTDSRNSTSRINELLAIEVSPQVIDYGLMRATNISTDDVNMTLINIGNTPFNVSVFGYAQTEGDGDAMQCESGSIPIQNQRYSVNSSRAFSAMLPLGIAATPISNLSLLQRTDDLFLGRSSNMTYWKVQIPSLVRGVCNGTVLFKTYLG